MGKNHVRKLSRVLVVLLIILCLLPAVAIPALASGQEKSKCYTDDRQLIRWQYTYWQNQYAPYLGYQYYNMFCDYNYGQSNPFWQGYFNWSNIVTHVLQNPNCRWWFVGAHGEVSGGINPYFGTDSDELISAYLCAPPTRNHNIPFVELWTCNSYGYRNSPISTWPDTLGILPIGGGGIGSHKFFIGYEGNLWRAMCYNYNQAFLPTLINQYNLQAAADAGCNNAYWLGKPHYSSASYWDYDAFYVRYHGDPGWNAIYP